MSLSILLAFGAMIGWGIGDFLIQKTIKAVGALETLCWITLFSSLLLLPVVWPNLKELNLYQWLVLTGLGLVNFASGFIHFQALKIGKLSVVETILSIELPLTILLGIIFFREILTARQIALMISLFIGIILVSVNFERIYKRDFLEKGALLAILSGFVIALVNFLSADQARAVSPLMAIWLPWFICGLTCFGYLSRRQFRRIFQHGREHWKLILPMVIIDLFAWLAYVFAVAHEELAITIAITESYVIVALLLGVFINREKIKFIQYAGAAMAILSSLAIGLISH